MTSESSLKRFLVNYTCSSQQNVNTVKKKNSHIIIKNNQDNQDGLTFNATKNDNATSLRSSTPPTLIISSNSHKETDDLICENKHTSLQKFINKPEIPISITSSNAEIDLSADPKHQAIKHQADENEDDGK
jgi:hypothetical protein